MQALCWIDIETTGLDPNKDSVLEIYVEITDLAFNSLYSFHMWVNYIPHVSRDILPAVAYYMHADSGLWDAMDGTPITDFYGSDKVQMDIDFSGHLDFVSKSHDISVFYPAGSSVHFDTGFLRAIGLPLTMSKLSHRHFDVTTLKLFMEMQTGFKPEFEEILPKHRAFSDVKSSMLVAKQICIPMTDTSLRASHIHKVISST